MPAYIEQYTPDQIYQSLQFKYLKKMILEKYPWIKNITIKEEWLSKYNTIYLLLEINPLEFAEFYHTRVDEGLVGLINHLGEYWVSSLSLISDISRREAEAIQMGIQYLMDKYTKTTSIPPSLKLRGRSFGIDGFIAYKNLLKDMGDEEQDDV
jgi:hypothetical protein